MCLPSPRTSAPCARKDRSRRSPDPAADSSMALFRVTLAYDGTEFLGWQGQGRRREARTVQGVLEEALGRLAGGERVVVAGAGRTDTGVHALGQVASFELPRELGAEELLRALNGLLPGDVR